MIKKNEIEKIRNIGVMAHIDAGKTTTTERILFYTGKVHRIGEVDDGAATMDWMQQEKERGITITAAAITCYWKDYRINIIDTPGHVDFTAEVERSLRILDGAIVVFCAAGGVEPQSETVWRQADKYHIPRIAFINKMDRIGADYYATVRQIQDKLEARPLPLFFPMGKEDEFTGIVDIVRQKSILYDEESFGSKVSEVEIPPAYQEQAMQYHHQLLEALSDHDDSVMEKFLSSEPVPEPIIHRAIRNVTLTAKMVPVLCGAAVRNKGVQQLIDAIIQYLPSPVDIPDILGENPFTGKMESRKSDSEAPLAALAFKIQSDPYVGKLTYLRIYSGCIKNGMTALNTTSDKKERFNKILLMAANKKEEIDNVDAGNITAVVGLRSTRTGDTLCDPRHPIILEKMQFPVPVIFVAIEAKSKPDQEKLIESLHMLTDEDPTFQFSTDPETGQMIIAGMGELHLEILIDRLLREFKVHANVGKPQVAYRETITESVTSEIKLIRQAGGKGLYAHIVVEFSPAEAGKIFEFENNTVGGTIPKEFIKPVMTGIREAMVAGCIAGYPVIDIKANLIDGSFHDEDSSELAFKIAGSMALQDAIKKGNPILMEPMMSLEVISPDAYFGAVLQDLAARRAKIEGHNNRKTDQVIDAKVPLAEMFGYATALRNLSQGRAIFTMQFERYDKVTGEVAKKLLEKMGLAA